jgi:hypothetical protein
LDVLLGAELLAIRGDGLPLVGCSGLNQCYGCRRCTTNTAGVNKAWYMATAQRVVLSDASLRWAAANDSHREAAESKHRKWQEPYAE